MKRKVKLTAKNIDDYLTELPDDQRVALKKLRRTIHAVAPKAEECISYQIPSFRLDGRLLVSFAAWVNHCAFYPGSHPLKVHQEALKAYDTDKGTLRFQTNNPLPAALVRKLLKTRMLQQDRLPTRAS